MRTVSAAGRLGSQTRDAVTMTKNTASTLRLLRRRVLAICGSLPAEFTAINLVWSLCVALTLGDCTLRRMFLWLWNGGWVRACRPS
jgi:hypothetical protein